jgi:UDP-N-acetylglucosamine 2-epimerase
MKKKIVTIIGTRPEIIKMFPLINQLDEHFNNILVWSGQHYDYSMVSNIFMDVGLRRPNFFIKINKKKNLFIEIQKKIFEIIKKTKPIGIIYHGDTFTTLASAIISRFFYQNITNVHIEGGYRSFDKAQTEEQVRFVSDHISKINFVSRKDDKINLNKENLKSNIVVVGNTINDSIKKIISKKKNRKYLLEKYNIKKSSYIYCTLHRSENVDDIKRLKKIIEVINLFSKKYKIIFPMHPRTKKQLIKNKIHLDQNVIITKPLNFSSSIHLLSECLFCFSDSGGLQEESVILGKRCLIPLNYTPHDYYIDNNANVKLNLEEKSYLKKSMHFLKITIQNNKIKYFRHKKNVSISICKKLVKIL